MCGCVPHQTDDFWELCGIVYREKAALAVFITLESPSSEMTKEAASSGYYKSDFWQKDYPKIQILTIEDSLKCGEVKMPPDFGIFKQVPKGKKSEGKQTDLDI